MRQSLLSAGRSNLELLVVASGFALVGVMAACAEAPVDEDPGGTTSQVNKAEPEHESQTLPPSNPPAPKAEETDAGKDSGKSSTSSSSSGGSSSGGTSSSGGSSGGSTSSSGGSTSSSGGAGASCDPNDPLNVILAFDEASKPTPRTCGFAGGTCKATECCFDAYGVCIDSL